MCPYYVQCCITALHPVASAPTSVMAVQEGLNSIRVSWSPPTPLGDTTGYRIYYSGGSSGNEDVSGGSTDNYLLTGLRNGNSYTISIVATSQHLSSNSWEGLNIGLGELVLHTISSRVYVLTTCIGHFVNCFVAVPGQPSVSVTGITATSISLSWSVLSGSVVDSYEVMWQRDTSGECSDEDEGSYTITDGSTSYDIMRLEEDSSYSITVTATNIAGSSTVRDAVTAMTLEAGEKCVATVIGHALLK